MKIFKKLLYKYSNLYETYKKVSDVFVEPELHFYSSLWTKSNGLPVYRCGNIISIAKYGEYDKAEGKYGDWAKYTYWDENFLKEKSWWGRTWRKFIRPHYQLPIWLSFYVFNWKEHVKSKYDFYSYESAPQFTIVLFNWSWNWYLSAPHASSDYLSKKTGRSYPDNDAYWESIYDYLDVKENNMANALDTVYTYISYTPSEKKKYNELIEKGKNATPEEKEKLFKEREKLGLEFAKLRCRPEYIKEAFIEEYFNEAEKKENNEKYKNHIWVW